MALSSVVGDLCWFGYAFASEGFVSLPKLVGSVSALFAHGLLLAYGDEQAQKVAGEGGDLSAMVLELRSFCQKQLKHLPEHWIGAIQARPVGIPFIMLGMNGVGLFIDALDRMMRHPNTGMIMQTIVGVLVILGTAAFALADYVKEQGVADRLLRIAPVLFLFATFSTIWLAVKTLNGFLVVAAIAFIVSNLSGFFAKIDKNNAPAMSR